MVSKSANTTSTSTMTNSNSEQQYKLPSLTGIPVLTGSSTYLEWSKQMKNALKIWGMYQKFKKAQHPTHPVPLTEHANTILFFAICGTTTGTARVDVDAIDDDLPNSGMLAWEALADRYQRVDPTTKTVLKKEFEVKVLKATKPPVSQLPKVLKLHRLHPVLH